MIWQRAAMLKLLQLETKDLRTASPSPQPEAQRDSWHRGVGGSGEMLGVQGQNLSLRFNINCGNFTRLSAGTIVATPWNPTSSSIILLDTWTSDLSRHLNTPMSHTQKHEFPPYHCPQCIPTHLIIVLPPSMLPKTFASKHSLQLLSRLPLSPQPDPFPELWSWEAGCANRNFAHWEGSLVPVIHLSPHHQRRSALWFHLHGQTGFLSLTHCRKTQTGWCNVTGRLAPSYSYPCPEQPFPGSWLMFLIKGTFLKDKTNIENLCQCL